MLVGSFFDAHTRMIPGKVQIHEVFISIGELFWGVGDVGFGAETSRTRSLARQGTAGFCGRTTPPPPRQDNPPPTPTTPPKQHVASDNLVGFSLSKAEQKQPSQ